MKKLQYQEIREGCKLIEYDLKLAVKANFGSKFTEIPNTNTEHCFQT